MAAKAPNRFRLTRRSRRIRKSGRYHWLIVLAARTLANIVVMVVAHWLRLLPPGGE